MKTLLLMVVLCACAAVPNARSQEAKDWLTPAGNIPKEAVRSGNRLDEVLIEVGGAR